MTQAIVTASALKNKCTAQAAPTSPSRETSTSTGVYHFHFISSRFVYIAIQEALDGKVVDRMEQVSETQAAARTEWRALPKT